MLVASPPKIEPASRISVTPTTVRFDGLRDHDAERKLEELLKRNYEYTSRLNITRPEDVYFDGNARIQGKYKITTNAIAQLCSRLVPGLSQAVNSVAGTFLDDDTLDVSDAHDMCLGLKWINDAIKLRFKKLGGYSLVVDQEKKLIEGIVGKKYAFLHNIDLYTRVKQALRSSRNIVFSDAALAGRRLMLRFRDVEPMFNVSGHGKVEQFHAGMHFSNSETGDCSIKAARVLIRHGANTKAISEFADGGRITHVSGGTFESRFIELLDKIKSNAIAFDAYRNQMAGLMVTNLGFGVEQSRHDKRVKQIEALLVKQGLTAEFSQSVVKHLLHYGSYRNDQLSVSSDPMRAYATRTAFDLYTALTHKAKTLPVEDQEKAEQTAYKLLTRKFFP